MDEIREECGVFGIWSNSGKAAARKIYYGLTALQHRGQESAGIAICDTSKERGNIRLHKDMGLVGEVFGERVLSELEGNIGIGHVRYSTTGESSPGNAQPIAFQYLKGSLALAHNGNIVNASELKEQLLEDGSVFNATTDSEVIATFIAKNRAHTGSIEEAVKMTIPHLKGGYALIIMSPRKLVAVRDSLGLKPLCIGKTEDGYAIASESCALDSINAEFIRDVLPGEILTVKDNKIISDTEGCIDKSRHAHCIFEYIYFARLDSKLDGVSIYSARINAGRALARSFKDKADIVAGVPESGITAAMGFSMESGIPYTNIFCKNSYIGRTFIKPDQSERESAVHMKLGVISQAVEGRSIVLIDDSIVRGTTIARLIDMLKQKGAKSVHVRICSPPFLHPCYYGTDVPDEGQLIAKKKTTEQIRDMIGADSLEYMKIEDLESMTGDLALCKACFDGNYPTAH